MPVVENVSLGGGQIAMLQKVTQLSRTDILALISTGINLVPAPGPGLIQVPFGFYYVYDFGSHPYVVVAAQPDRIIPEYGLNGDQIGATVSGVISASADSVGYANGVLNQFGGPIAEDVNQPIVLFGANYNAGPILTATLGAGGAGYVANDTGTITNGANDATYKVLTVGAGGAVLTFQITGAGTACTVANGNATVDGGAQPGVGAGFTVNITAVQTGDGTLKVVTYYQIIPVP
jgi:hypothetical protein